MLKINRIKAVSKTELDSYGFDYILNAGLNLISSSRNTRGKSSAILAIYYCLGFEEIVGGRGVKTLTSVYKNSLLDDKEISHSVLESEAWIEITNGTDVVTLLRSARLLGRSENLVTVFYCKMDSVNDPEVFYEDMYVHSQRSTTSAKGFHNFLEKFIGLELPLVPTNDEAEYKLYLQLLFSVIFIEQKRGWADLFSAMPVLNIKDAKKRVIEYLLSLDTLKNEKKRASLRSQETTIIKEWSVIVNEIQAICNREGCIARNLPMNPQIFDDQTVVITIDKQTIELTLEQLDNELQELKGTTPKIVDNFESLQIELNKTEESISSIEQELSTQQQNIITLKSNIRTFTTILESINEDIRNNKDSLKLKEMGSKLQIKSYSGICPVCNQPIEDSLLPSQVCEHLMSIENNIKHLESQREMLLFALKANKGNLTVAEENERLLSGRIFTLRRLAKMIRSDLYSIDDNFSESMVYKKIGLENRIQMLNSLKDFVYAKVNELKVLSLGWSRYLQERSEIPKANLSKNDKNKISKFDDYFKMYLREFNYQSIVNYDSIQISIENYLPISEGFDMKFDSSASDNIRAIWAYTLALLRTSIETSGNHPQIVLFDEPAQHSIIPVDVLNLFNAVIGIPGNNQIILGITLNDEDLKAKVSSFNKELLHVIDVGEHSFKKTHQIITD